MDDNRGEKQEIDIMPHYNQKQYIRTFQVPTPTDNLKKIHVTNHHAIA